MTAKWIIPAPVWDCHGGYQLKGLRGAAGWCFRELDGSSSAAIFESGVRMFHTEAEARAWVEEEARRVLGAEVAG